VIATQYNEKIRNHGRFPLLIKLNHIVFVQPFQCHFNHANSTIYDHLSRINNSRSLLSLQHNSCNLRSISQIGDACLNNLKTSLCNLLLNLIPDPSGYDFAGTT